MCYFLELPVFYNPLPYIAPKCILKTIYAKQIKSTYIRISHFYFNRLVHCLSLYLDELLSNHQWEAQLVQYLHTVDHCSFLPCTVSWLKLKYDLWKMKWKYNSIFRNSMVWHHQHHRYQFSYITYMTGIKIISLTMI